MKKIKGLGLSLIAISAFALASCNSKNIESNSNNVENSNNIVDSNAARVTNSNVSDPENTSISITSDFKIVDANGIDVSPVNGVYTINTAGEYTLSGKLADGYININANDAEVILNLENVDISSSTNSPIYVSSASKVEISAKKETYNIITDNRSGTYTSDDEAGSAAIFSLADLKLKGQGTLIVKGNYNNGVHTKDDLDVKNLTLKVEAKNNALKGNDSVTIDSGNLLLISTAGDGIKTTNSDISSKGNQRGIITLNGASIDIYAACDGIDASYDVIINETEDSTPKLNIYTGNYSNYSSSTSTNEETLYLRIPSSYYSSNYQYKLYFYNDLNDGIWVDATYYDAIRVSNGRSTSTYYFYSLTKPSDYSNVAIYLYNSTETDLTNYIASTKGGTINTAKDLFIISSISSTNKTISGDWSNYSTSTQSANKQQTTLAYSAKGIKADNEVTINGGSIYVKATDDAIHANNDNTLENNNTPLGNVNLNGGTLELYSNDDAVHADSILTVDGSKITVVSSYEGLEGNYVKFKSGTAYILATDDGVNASKEVNVSGGYLDVSVGSGDTDGIDSNGNYAQSGGFVISKCATTDTSGNMAALDIDGTCTITGGTFISVGPMSALPSSSSVNYVKFGSGGMGGMGGPGMGNPFGMQSNTSSISFSSGTYTISNTDISFNLSSSYTNMWIASSYFTTNTTYTLSNGTNSYSWTQNSQSVTYSA